MHSRFGVFEQLFNDSIVKLDASNKSQSVHQLVQAEFLFQATLIEWQEAFEAATTLLLECSHIII